VQVGRLLRLLRLVRLMRLLRMPRILARVELLLGQEWLQVREDPGARRGEGGPWGPEG
jgi:hypothetical protein